MKFLGVNNSCPELNVDPSVLMKTCLSSASSSPPLRLQVGALQGQSPASVRLLLDEAENNGILKPCDQRTRARHIQEVNAEKAARRHKMPQRFLQQQPAV